MKLQDLIAGFQALSPQKKFIALFLLVSVLVGVSLITLVGSRPDFEMLYANIEEEEATEVVATRLDLPFTESLGGLLIGLVCGFQGPWAI